MNDENSLEAMGATWDASKASEIVDAMEAIWKACNPPKACPDFILSNNIRHRCVMRWKGRRFVIKQSFYELFMTQVRRAKAN